MVWFVASCLDCGTEGFRTHTERAEWLDKHRDAGHRVNMWLEAK